MDALTDLTRRLTPIPGERPAVQRVLVADGARLVLFAFAAGQRLREHRAAFPIVVQALSGRLRFASFGADGAAEQSAVVLEPGAVAHLPAREWHEVVAETDAVLLLTMLDPDAASTPITGEGTGDGVVEEAELGHS